MLIWEVDLVERSCWDFMTPGCNWQPGLRLLAYKLKRVILSSRAYTFWSIASSIKIKRYKVEPRDKQSGV